MLSSLSLGSIDNLEKLPINSLNSICDRVRQALLHVFLPRLCEKCQPIFSQAFRKTQSTPLLLKVLCESCKINYVKDKRSVSRKKPVEKVEGETGNNSTGKCPAKKKSTSTISQQQQKNRLSEISRNNHCVGDRDDITGNINNHIVVNNQIINNNKNLTVKIKLISALKSNSGMNGPINHPLPLTPPPTEDEEVKFKKMATDIYEESEDLTVLIDNSETEAIEHEEQIYEYLSKRNVDWCRYCGVAGDTGTFWKLGPWGDRTLCHKHGCEFFGCGFARVTRTRLDLTEFYGEKKVERKLPIISEFCSICWDRKETMDKDANDSLDCFITCHGCPLSFHKNCLQQQREFSGNCSFFCSPNCHENFGKCLIRPQFPPKFKFPFYRQILTLAEKTDESNSEEKENNFKVKINLKRKSEESSNSIVLSKRPKNRKRKQIQNDQVVVAFLPIKIDQTIHQHEIINTPQWIKKSLNDRFLAYEQDDSEETEDLSDEIILNRHARYEHVEKTTRLLKPGVLSQLISEAKINK